ncbi:MAG: glycoside hydrolase family 3 N-terminal domain-containing protein [Bdellovibrionota bacterium]
MARELKAIGVNCNFTPVADVQTNPNNPIMLGRTFGSDPEVVAKLVAATIDVFEDEAVLSCAKHFPGHGDTIVDSHLELPHVDTDRNTLLSRELIPFARAVKHRVPMIMTAHIMYPDIDPQHPATLSKYFLQTLLRKKLGFQGCIVSDDLEMKAIAHHYKIDQACVASIMAGCNMALVCEDQVLAYACYEALQQKIDHKDLQARLQENQKLFRQWDQSYLRSKRLRKRAQWGWTSHHFPQI